MDTIINQQIINGRLMDCPIIVLAQQYKTEADELTDANQVFDKENEFRRALVQRPEFTPTQALAMISYFFKNENSYSKKQQAEIVDTYLTYIMNSITPENKTLITRFLHSLLPKVTVGGNKKEGKIEAYPRIKALVESKLNESI